MLHLGFLQKQQEYTTERLCLVTDLLSMPKCKAADVAGWRLCFSLWCRAKYAERKRLVIFAHCFALDFDFGTELCLFHQLEHLVRLGVIVDVKIEPTPKLHHPNITQPLPTGRADAGDFKFPLVALEAIVRAFRQSDKVAHASIEQLARFRRLDFRIDGHFLNASKQSRLRKCRCGAA